MVRVDVEVPEPVGLEGPHEGERIHGRSRGGGCVVTTRTREAAGDLLAGNVAPLGRDQHRVHALVDGVADLGVVVGAPNLPVAADALPLWAQEDRVVRLVP